jgi:uncharacterized protein
MRLSGTCRLLRQIVLIALLAIQTLLPLPLQLVKADGVAQRLPFAQNWSAVTLLNTNDDWSRIAGIEGYLGQNLTTAIGADPQLLSGTSTLAGDLDLIANQSNPGGLSSGGVAEFDGIADPVIALQGSSTADAPYLLLSLDTTGSSNLNIAYNLRDLDGSADDAIQPVALQYRIGNSGNFINLPAGFVADATSGPGLATRVTPVSVILPAETADRPLVQVRIITSNANGNDEWVGIDDLVVSAGGPATFLTIDDVSRPEGSAGTSPFIFTVRLSAPAGIDGVTFDIATVDGTARAAGTSGADYASRRLNRQTIAAGASGYSFEVLVNGDTVVEPNELFTVELTAVSGAVVSDGQGQGTIENDDFSTLSIHDIQGQGSESPLAGAVVRTRGVVTGRRSTGFFIQEPAPDSDPLTSEGLAVYTGSAPPAAVAVGNLVEVSGTVSEYVPSADPLQPPLTQLTQPTVTLVATGQPLPSPVVLTPSFPAPSGAFDQLERVEGMRVSVPSLTVCAPTLGSINEVNATASSSGIFFGVVTGVARPFREPGIQAPDPSPAGTIPPIPRFDANPERIRIDSDGLTGGTTLNLSVGTVITGLVGPLDYALRSYTLLPEPGSQLATTGGVAAAAVTVSDSSEFTVATFNLQRFYDTVNDPSVAEPVLTATAFNNRLTKASLAIRNYLRSPDIIGVVEVENLSTLQSLAARIGSDAAAAGQPDPQYAAYLVEGNDVGGIDVGFLLRTSRVSVETVTQELAASRLINPDGTTDLLNDRPPLRLRAVINHSSGSRFPVTVIVNHLRSLGGVSDPSPGSSGWPTAGHRVRAKRQRQAEDLARLVQARQLADPAERIILIGDFNAFEFNDGFTDSINTIIGRPAPDNETAVAGDGLDLVGPDLVNLSALSPAADRYSYVFDGNAQSLDHLLVSQSLVSATLARRVEHPRLNADFPETARNDAATPIRLSDHDPLVGYFKVADFCTAPSPTLAYAPAVEIFAGGSLTIAPTSGPLPIPVNGAGTISILSRGSFIGTIAVDSSGNVSITRAGPVGTHSIIIRLTNACGQTKDALIQVTVTPVIVGPGSPVPALPPADRPVISPPTGLNAGSVLFFNAYSSSTDYRHDSMISLTNTNPAQSVSVRILFIDGQTGAAESRFLTLTPNQTIRFLASDQDPGVTGYIMALAIDDHGCPLNFNYLIGEAAVRFESGHASNLAAIAVAAIADSDLLCQPGLVIDLPFDGNVFQMLPRTLAVNSVPSRLDGNQTLLIVNRLGGNLTNTISPIGTISGSLYNDVEAEWYFTIQGNSPQLRGIMASATFPLTSLRFENVVPAGRTGWMRLATTAETGIIGAVINLNSSGYNNGHNLHALTLTPSTHYLLPIVSPSSQ